MAAISPASESPRSGESSNSSQATSTSNGRQWAIITLWTKGWELKNDFGCLTSAAKVGWFVLHLIGSVLLTLPALGLDFCRICSSNEDENDSVVEATRGAFEDFQENTTQPKQPTAPQRSSAQPAQKAAPSSSQTVQTPQGRAEQARRKFLDSSKWKKEKVLGKGQFGEVSLYSYNQEKFVVKWLDLQKVMSRDLQYWYQANRNGGAPKRGEGTALHFPDHPNVLKTLGLILYDARNGGCVLHHDIKRPVPSHLLVVGTITEPLDSAEELEGMLMSRSQNQSQLPGLEEVRHFSIGIASGLGALHQEGFVHRDLKPANVLRYRTVDGSYDYKLIDFGFARNINERNPDGKTGTICGSIFHVSPEMLIFANGGDRYDPSTPDRWAFGLMLYEYAFGRLPSFCHHNTQQKLHRAIRSQANSGKTIQETDQAWIKRVRSNSPLADNKEFWDLLNRLICSPDKRLSYEEIVEHSFFTQNA